jgi:hypothetical protein
MNECCKLKIRQIGGVWRESPFLDTPDSMAGGKIAADRYLL